jgi:hypothetical protein
MSTPAAASSSAMRPFKATEIFIYGIEKTYN